MYHLEVKGKKNLEKKNIFVGVLKVLRRKEQDPNSLVRGLDPPIQIRTKMSQTRYTASCISTVLLSIIFGDLNNGHSCLRFP